ncbi:hypothetical protein N1851_023087 [Merluccius polli]|uniref:Uncharacterized protein n=1 Tax=Merluccius polli TaxID=89951 RepID=A0AA47MH21_MERPO|nr:hypothetical protein N1851_023087 [Merluccius polli]
MHCFPLLRCRMVVQNLFEAVRKSFSMASPNSSHVRVFASATAAAVLRLACRLTASLTAIVHQRVRELPPRQAPTTLRPQLRSAALTMEARNMAHLGLNVPRLPRVSKTCGRKSDDTTTKSIIELRPRVSWCQWQLQSGRESNPSREDQSPCYALSSGSFPTREVTFHVPRASFCSRGIGPPSVRPPSAAAPAHIAPDPFGPLLLVVRSAGRASHVVSSGCARPGPMGTGPATRRSPPSPTPRPGQGGGVPFLIMSKTGQFSLEDVMSYELCSFPAALFEGKAVTEFSSKKSNKTVLDSIPPTEHYVLDGGSLIFQQTGLNLMTMELEKKGCTVINASGDADIDIVKAAVKASEHQPT